MKNDRFKTYFSTPIAFLLIFSMMLSCFYGCGDDSGGDEESSDLSGYSASENTVGSENSETSDSTEDLSSSTSANSSGTVSTGNAYTSQKPVTSGSSGGSTSGRTSNTSGSGSKTTTKSSSSSKTTKKSTASSKTTTKSGSKATTAPPTTKSSTYYAPKVYTNSAPGTATFSAPDGTAVVDYSNASSGYIMIRYSGAYSNIRVQVAGPNGVTQTYPIFSKNYEAVPLTGGSGTYSIMVLGNNGGTSYFRLASDSIQVSLSSSTAPYVRPNLFVNYTSSTACVQYAATLTRGCDTDIAKVEAIYEYVVSNFKYDTAKASSVAASAYVPNLNSVWSSKKGICLDYAAVMAAMLRTQGIPTKLEAGQATGAGYHAWISVYINGSGWINNIIYFNGNSWKLMDPTFASTGGANYDWANKVGHAVQYTY